MCGREGFIPDPSIILNDEIVDVDFSCNAFVNSPNFQEGACDELQDLLSEACECAPVDSCFLCPDNALSLHPDAIPPTLFGEQRTYEEWMSQVESQTFPACSGVALPSFDIASFCCPRMPLPQTCSLCGDGEEVVDGSSEVPSLPGVTCRTASEAAKYFTESGCANLTDVREFCCSGATQAPPTSAPVVQSSPTSTPVVQSSPTSALVVQSSPTSSPVVQTAPTSAPQGAQSSPTFTPVSSPTTPETSSSTASFHPILTTLLSGIITLVVASSNL